MPEWGIFCLYRLPYSAATKILHLSQLILECWFKCGKELGQTLPINPPYAYDIASSGVNALSFCFRSWFMILRKGHSIWPTAKHSSRVASICNIELITLQTQPSAKLIALLHLNCKMQLSLQSWWLNVQCFLDQWSGAISVATATLIYYILFDLLQISYNPRQYSSAAELQGTYPVVDGLRAVNRLT